MEKALRVLCAVDGSEESYEGARALIHLASLQQLIILSVLDIPGLRYQAAWFRIEDLPTLVESEMREDAERFLDQVASILPSDVGPISRQIKKGNPSEIILDVGARSGADLIVLGARGLSQLSELAFGSVSHRVVTHASCSTLVVKSPIPRLQHVLLPIQGLEDTKTALTFLGKKPFREAPQITVLHVVPFAQPIWLEGAMVPESYRDEIIAAGESLINQVGLQLSSLGYKATPHLMIGSPSKMILKHVSETRPDLILMGSHGKRGLSRFLLGSVSHGVTHHTPCSVLILR